MEIVKVLLNVNNKCWYWPVNKARVLSMNECFEYEVNLIILIMVNTKLQAMKKNSVNQHLAINVA